jgi:hypothetical protein
MVAVVVWRKDFLTCAKIVGMVGIWVFGTKTREEGNRVTTWVMICPVKALLEA